MRLLLGATEAQDPVWVYAVVLGGLAIIGFLFWFLNHRYPSKRGHHGSVGNALMRMEASFLPGREHMVEAAGREDVEEDDQGELPEKGYRKRERRD